MAAANRGESLTAMTSIAVESHADIERPREDVVDLCREPSHEPGAFRRAAIAAVKLVHTLVWLSIESCMVYLLWAGFTGRSDRRAARAAGVVGGETLVFAANRCRCPLTQVAERVGAEDGAVTDIFLPRWFARSLPAIHVPLIMLAGHLHRRNLRQR